MAVAFVWLSYGFGYAISPIIRALKLTFDTLRTHLSGEPARAYLVTGDEALLVGEAADAIRARGKRAGFEEREVFFIERVADWEACAPRLTTCRCSARAS